MKFMIVLVAIRRVHLNGFGAAARRSEKRVSRRFL
jgi:hypothetical protein